MPGTDRAFIFLNRGHEEGPTESCSEDAKEMGAISLSKGEQRLSGRSVSTATDKCVTEGCSPSCGIMVCSCHPPSQVVHEAR